MPASSERTRRLLVESATDEFAEHGVRGASLLEISRRAGQRNRASVHYHFGSRAGMLAAVLSQHHEFLRARNAELRQEAASTPPDDLVPAVRALALPAIELGETGTAGRGYLSILAELSVEGIEDQEPAVVEAMTSSGGYENWQLLTERLAVARPDLDEVVRDLRRDKACEFVMRVVADRGRDLDRVERGLRARALTVEAFSTDVVSMTVGLLGAP